MIELTEFEKKLVDYEVLQYMTTEHQLEDAQNLGESIAAEYLHNKLVGIVNNVSTTFANNPEDFLDRINVESENYKLK